jgi:hypothetical protein
MRAPEFAPLPVLDDGRHDFNFIAGRWQVHNRRLLKPLAGSTQWEEFDAVQDGSLLLGGLGNMNDLSSPETGAIGMTLRFFNPQTRLWRIYAVAQRDGLLRAPLVGAFRDGIGRFEGVEQHEGRPVRVRLEWSGITPRRARWEQAFSTDDGRSWESNWVMTLSRPQY